MNFKQGQVFEFVYPFYDYFVESWKGESQHIQYPGCHKSMEDDGSGYGTSIYWTANNVGKIAFEVLSIAKMPGKYMDRVVAKKYYTDPVGKLYSSGDVVIMTTGKLERYIERNYVFPWDYDVDSAFKEDAPAYQPQF